MLRVESRPSRQLCVCEMDQDGGGRAGGDPRGASASQVKGQERPESRVCAHTIHLKSFLMQVLRDQLVSISPAAPEEKGLDGNTELNTKDGDFLLTSPLEVHCMTWSLELLSVTKSPTIKENI